MLYPATQRRGDATCKTFAIDRFGEPTCVFGIELDGNHRFLLSDFAVMHDSTEPAYGVSVSDGQYVHDLLEFSGDKCSLFSCVYLFFYVWSTMDIMQLANLTYILYFVLCFIR